MQEIDTERQKKEHRQECQFKYIQLEKQVLLNKSLRKPRYGLLRRNKNEEVRK